MTHLDDSPLVSVITIFLNGKDFIEEAIESVLGQTYRHWELLLVDDGSTDASTSIARSYAQRYPGKIRYLEHEGHANRGMSASRNLGISQAAGEYIGFVDADDVLLAENLERHVATLQAQPMAGMVTGPVKFWWNWSEQAGEERPADTIIGMNVAPGLLYRPPTLLRLFLQGRTHAPVPSGVLLRRDAVHNVGGFEDEFRGMSEDRAFFTKVFLHESVYVTHECLCLYRQHPQTACEIALRSGKWALNRPNLTEEVYIEWLERYLSSQSDVEADIRNALDRLLWPYRHRHLYRLSQYTSAIARTTRYALESIQVVGVGLRRQMLRKSTGWITADPNQIFVHDRSGAGKTNLTWGSSRASDLEIRINAPDGPLFARSGPRGSQRSDRNVIDGTVFYLQDVSDGLPLTMHNTLSRVRIGVTFRPNADSEPIACSSSAPKVGIASSMIENEEWRPGNQVSQVDLPLCKARARQSAATPPPVTGDECSATATPENQSCAPPVLQSQSPRVFGLMMVRNAADIIRTNILHHLNLGFDCFLIVDNGSSDGTDCILEELSSDPRVRWLRFEGPYWQSAIITQLAHEAYLRGADWVIPIDADEFLCVRKGSLKGALSTSPAGAIRIGVVNFIQRRDEHQTSPESLLHMTRRVCNPYPLDPTHQAVDLVERGKIGFVEREYDPKWISRASPALEIGIGNHFVIRAPGPHMKTSDIVILHAPLRSRAALESRLEHGKRDADAGNIQAWHTLRWRGLGHDVLLDAEWAANSYQDDHLDVYGERHQLVFDSTLRDVVAPWIDSTVGSLKRDPTSGYSPPLELDRARFCASESLVRPVLSRVRQITGRLDEHEVLLLMATAALVLAEHGPQPILEVGNDSGCSTVALGSVVRAVCPEARLCLVGSGQGELTWDQPIALLFIDRLHDYINVARAFCHFERWVVPGGYVAFGSYHRDDYPGAMAFVDGLLRFGGYREIQRAGRTIVIQKIQRY